jgi:Ceramidase
LQFTITNRNGGFIMTKYRGFFVWGGGILLILVPFLIFVGTGWPGKENSCLYEKPFDGCFCEEFNKVDVLKGNPGVRQPVNTWFNLYSIATAFLVAWVVYKDREALDSGTPPNLMKSNTLMPDVYIFAVLFLGLGSMWFHASIKQWGGLFDGLSMYIYASFLVWYSWRRLWNCSIFFWIGYPATVIFFTSMHNRIPSFVLILILVIAYVIVEVSIWIRTGRVMQRVEGSTLTPVLWVSAVVAILMATFFWKLSQTGGLLCWPKSAFQAHGLLWHPLAGVMAVLLYFYWRESDDPSAQSDRCLPHS